MTVQKLYEYTVIIYASSLKTSHYTFPARGISFPHFSRTVLVCLLYDSLHYIITKYRCGSSKSTAVDMDRPNFTVECSVRVVLFTSFVESSVSVPSLSLPFSLSRAESNWPTLIHSLKTQEPSRIILHVFLVRELSIVAAIKRTKRDESGNCFVKA